MNQPFSVNELIDGLGKTVQSTIELVAKTSPLDIRTVETAVESGLDKIRDRLASDFELVKKTEYETNVELLKVLKSGRITMGNKTLSFERKFAKKIGTKFAVMVNSGSSANLISVASLFFKKDNPLKRWDEVIVPAV